MSAVLAAFYFIAHVALGSATESNVWAERSRGLSRARPPPQLAALPAGATFRPSTLLNQLPPVTRSLSTLTKLTPSVKSGAVAEPTRIQQLINAVPLLYGSVQDVYNGGDARVAPVVILQDVHLNTEAQTNIASILQQLIDEKQVGLVGVEGAFRAFDFAPFRRFSNKEITKLVVEDALRQNLLAAPSFVGMTSAAEPPPFVGVDDRVHYDANLEALYQARDEKAAALNQLDLSKRRLAEQKKTLFSKDLLDFDNRRTAYHQGGIGLGAYVKVLMAHDGEIDLVIEQFAQAYAMESRLDFERVEMERRRVVERLSKCLAEQEASELIAQSLAYRMGKLGFGTYYQNLRRLCERKGILLAYTPAFDDYIRYVLLSDGIKVEALFDSVEKMERQIVAKLARSPEEKTLVDRSEQTLLIEKLLDFSLTPNEWKTFESMDNGPWSMDKNLLPFKRFYEEADIRSRSMVDQLLSHPSTANKMIILGGFHAPHVAQQLREKKISHVIVSPKITKIDEGSGSAYLSVFDREKTPLDRLFAGEKLSVYPEHLAAGAGALSGKVVELAISVHGSPAESDSDGLVATYDPSRSSTERGVRLNDAVVSRKAPSLLGKIFSRVRGLLSEVPSLSGDLEEGRPVRSKVLTRERMQEIPWVTLSVSLTIVLLHAISVFTGNNLVRTLVPSDLDWIYQFIASGFVHLNWGHLFSNAIGILVVGTVVERKLKASQFGFVYVGALVFSEVIRMQFDGGAAVGASGALFALMPLCIFYIAGDVYRTFRKIVAHIKYLQTTETGEPVPLSIDLQARSSAAEAPSVYEIVQLLFCLVLIMICTEVPKELILSGAISQVAHWAHFGGMLFGIFAVVTSVVVGFFIGKIKISQDDFALPPGWFSKTPPNVKKNSVSLLENGEGDRIGDIQLGAARLATLVEAAAANDVQAVLADVTAQSFQWETYGNKRRTQAPSLLQQVKAWADNPLTHPILMASLAQAFKGKKIDWDKNEQAIMDVLTLAGLKPNDLAALPDIEAGAAGVFLFKLGHRPSAAQMALALSQIEADRPVHLIVHENDKGYFEEVARVRGRTIIVSGYQENMGEVLQKQVKQIQGVSVLVYSADLRNNISELSRGLSVRKPISFEELIAPLRSLNVGAIREIYNLIQRAA